MARKLLVYDTVNRRFVHALKYGSTILFKFKVRYKDVKINVRENEGAINNGQSRETGTNGSTRHGKKTKNKKQKNKEKTQHNTEN
jgi:hypothetical protein